MVNAAIAERIDDGYMSQAELARRLAVRPQTINKWLSGENTPPPARWREIEDVLEFEQGHLARVAGLVPNAEEGTRVDTVRAIRSDPGLDPDQVDDLLVLYRHYRSRNGR